MPPSANIEINGLAVSDDDLPINTLVQLSNADTGGEITYLWEILDQPEGTADVLSNPAIENPTFTPKKEGSYLIRLTVNDSLSTEVADKKIAAIRQLKTNERIPAAMETVEVDTAKGWKPATNRMLEITDDVARDANLIVCINPGASFPVVGDIVRFDQSALIKATLPGQERLLLCEKALATSAAQVAGTLGVVIATPTGASPSANGLVIVRKFGVVEAVEVGAPAVGDSVYVSDTAQPALVAGSNSRKIGKVVYSSGGSYQWLIDNSYKVSGLSGGAVFSWTVGMTWATIYDQMSLVSGPKICLVEYDTATNGDRSVTNNGGSPQDFNSILFVGLSGAPSDGTCAVLVIDDGIQFAPGPEGVRLSSQDVGWDWSALTAPAFVATSPTTWTTYNMTGGDLRGSNTPGVAAFDGTLWLNLRDVHAAGGHVGRCTDGTDELWLRAGTRVFNPIFIDDGNSNGLAVFADASCQWSSAGLIALGLYVTPMEVTNYAKGTGTNLYSIDVDGGGNVIATLVP